MHTVVLQIHRQLGITQKAAWFVLHRIREMLKPKSPVMLRNTAQIDETYVGGSIKNKHKSKIAQIKAANGGKDLRRRSDTKNPVIGICETGGKVVVKVTDWVTKKSAKHLIEKHIADGTNIVTDG